MESHIDIIDINGNKIYIEDGQVKTVFNDEIITSGYLDLEEARQLLHSSIDVHQRLYKLYNRNKVRQ